MGPVFLKRRVWLVIAVLDIQQQYSQTRKIPLFLFPRYKSKSENPRDVCELRWRMPCGSMVVNIVEQWLPDTGPFPKEANHPLESKFTTVNFFPGREWFTWLRVIHLAEADIFCKKKNPFFATIRCSACTTIKGFTKHFIHWHRIPCNIILDKRTYFTAEEVGSGHITMRSVVLSKAYQLEAASLTWK